MNYILDSFFAGNTFENVAKKAKELSADHPIVEFDFNGIKCLVSKNTNLDFLWRDYANAHRMEWKEVGPNCREKYSDKTEKELARRNKLAEEKEAQQHEEWEAEDKIQREKFEEKTKGIEIELADSDGWDEFKKNNTDPYGGCCVEYAEGWAKLMQAEMAQGKTIVDCAEKTSHELGFLGITGFMYGCAVAMLSQCWKHGEELRKWHNKEYGHEGEGVVNPAVLTIST